MRPPGASVARDLEIGAPPELVWDFVADFEGWSAWNPLFLRSKGRAEVGQTLQFTVAIPGMKPRKSRAQVRTVIEEELLEYGISGFAGLPRGFRFIEIGEITPTLCRVTNGEIFGGPIGKLLSRRFAGHVGRGLETMNLALKHVAERKWRGRPV